MSVSIYKYSALALVALSLTACSGGGGDGLLGFSGPTGGGLSAEDRAARLSGETEEETIFDLFDGSDDPNTTVEVNKYLWLAAQDILDFLPIEAVDPFTGVIVYGYGTPPGGGRSYRATVYVQDPALDARSIKVALASRSGAVPRATARAIEDAILTRARQIRIRDSRL